MESKHRFGCQLAWVQLTPAPAAQWFITIYSYSLPFDMVLRIWDVFMLVRMHSSPYSQPRKCGICPSFKGHSLSPRAKPQRNESQLPHPVFAQEGMKVVFRVGLQLLVAAKELLLTLPFEHLVSALRNVRALCPDDPRRVLKSALALRLAGRLVCVKPPASLS